MANDKRLSLEKVEHLALYKCMKKMPANYMQLSIQYEIKIAEINVNASGIFHFKRSKLKASLIDGIICDLLKETSL